MDSFKQFVETAPPNTGQEFQQMKEGNTLQQVIDTAPKLASWVDNILSGRGQMSQELSAKVSEFFRLVKQNRLWPELESQPDLAMASIRAKLSQGQTEIANQKLAKIKQLIEQCGMKARRMLYMGSTEGL